MKTISVPYTFTKAGYFYFSRRVPRDLVYQYRSKRVVIALKTRSAHQARALAGRAGVLTEDKILARLFELNQKSAHKSF